MRGCRGCSPGLVDLGARTVCTGSTFFISQCSPEGFSLP